MAPRPPTETLDGRLLTHVRLLMRSDAYRAWAGSYPKDAAKIEERLAGHPSLSPSTRFGLGLAGIISDGQPSLPAPLPLEELDPFWRRDVVLVRNLSSFSGLQRAAARSSGFSVIAVQLDHSTSVQANHLELALTRVQLAVEGWRLAGWGTYGQDTDPYVDGRFAATTVRELTLAGWIGNGEAWAEGAGRGKSRLFLDGWAATAGRGPLACAPLSSTTPSWARDFDYAAWLGVPGAAIGPQVYGASDAAYTVWNALATLEHALVPRSRTVLCFNVVGGDGPFTDYLTWAGPRWLYTGDDSTPSTFYGLRRR